MKLYLVKDLPLDLSSATVFGEGEERTHANTATIQCVLSTGSQHEDKCCKQLKTLLEDTFTSSDKQQEEVAKADEVPVHNAKRIKASPSVSPTGRELLIYSYLQEYSTPRKCKTIVFGMHGAIMEQIHNIFDREKKEVRVKLTMKIFLTGYLTEADALMGDGQAELRNISKFTRISTRKMKINLPSRESNVCYCADAVIIPKVLSKYWLKNGSRVSGKLTIKLIFNEFKDNLLHVKNILKNEICPDVVIVASNGAQINCHKNFLLSHNIHAFDAMFSNQHKFQEAQTCRVKMDDVSEEGVNAFLVYVYYGGIDVPSKNCGVALELLNMGNKYHIEALKSEMKSILLEKQEDDTWFTLDLAVELFVLAGGMKDGDWLKTCAIKVIKRNKSSLKSSDSLKSLLNGKDEILMEIMQYLC